MRLSTVYTSHYPPGMGRFPQIMILLVHSPTFQSRWIEVL